MARHAFFCLSGIPVVVFIGNREDFCACECRILIAEVRKMRLRGVYVTERTLNLVMGDEEIEQNCSELKNVWNFISGTSGIVIARTQCLRHMNNEWMATEYFLTLFFKTSIVTGRHLGWGGRDPNTRSIIQRRLISDPVGPMQTSASNIFFWGGGGGKFRAFS